MTGGVTGITQNESALDRYMLIAPELVNIINQFKTTYCIDDGHSARSDHYQLTGTMAARIFVNAGIVKYSVAKQCGGNTFIEKKQLMNLASNMIIPDDAKKDILHRDERGCTRCDQICSQRLIEETATISIWDRLPKMKLKTFNNYSTTINNHDQM